MLCLGSNRRLATWSMIYLFLVTISWNRLSQRPKSCAAGAKLKTPDHSSFSHSAARASRWNRWGLLDTSRQKFTSSCPLKSTQTLFFLNAQQRLHLLRKLPSIIVKKDILTLIESVLTLCSTFYPGTTLSPWNTNCFGSRTRPTKWSVHLKRPLSEGHDGSVIRKASLITEEPSHPLHQSLQRLPSGRRLKVPLAWKALDKKSFILFAKPTLNTLKWERYFALNSPVLCVSTGVLKCFYILNAGMLMAVGALSKRKLCHRLRQTIKDI